MSKRLFLIDGNSFCYRAFYAIRVLTTSRGRPTNAIYGFIAMLNKIIKEKKPDYLAVTFDLAGPTFRHEKFKEYKIQRQPMPDDLIGQLPLIKKVIRGYNIPIFEKQGFEADDVLASLARKAADKSMDVYIVTGDKDALQLVDSHIKVYSPHKEAVIYDRKAVMERFGVGPDKMVEIMALAGDPTDNIPGVPGIGEKTAVSLIKEFGTLENVLANLDKIRSVKLQQALSEFAEQARLSKELATVNSDLALDVDFDELKVGNSNNEALRSLFKEFEFKSLLKDLTSGKQALKTDYRLISSKEEFGQFLDKLKKLDGVTLDFETTGKDPMRAEPIGISFSWEEQEAYYIPLEQSWLEKSDIFKKLKPVLEDKNIKKYGQNIKYEVIILANYGIDLKAVAFDTMVASYLLNPSKPNHSLDEVALEYLDYRMISLQELIGKGKNKLKMRDIALEKLSEYSCEDADITMRLKKVLEPKLKEKGLYGLFCDVEIPLIKVLARMELNGVAVDTEMLAVMSKTMQTSLERITSDIYGLAKGEFNINSPKQLSRVLFEKLKLPVIKRTKTGFSTDVRVLEKLAPKHPLPAALLEYRELSKLKSTYVDAFPQLINFRTQRVHTSFNQTIAATGRLSSSQPNLQNIPIRTQAGKEIRKAIIAGSADSVIVSADYSQIELRVLAHLSKDESLIEAFNKGLDIHNHTASLIFAVDPKDVTSQMRAIAKTVNFGINYGMSPYGLSKSLGIEIEKAEEFISSYFARYPKVKDYMTSQIKKARQTGFVTTILNRRRYIPGMDSSNRSIREFAERTAVNTPVQGTAADLIKVAMIEIDNALAERGLSAKMILQVHDELVFEAPKDELKKIEELVKEKMEGVISLKIPIKVKIKTGKNWFEA
ncbi:MAG: DNA polymerase I [Candidatus Omnitrophota bacterium]|nr:DNA polymerase I [Candidatus Omnitrophota bacterium]